MYLFMDLSKFWVLDSKKLTNKNKYHLSGIQIVALDEINPSLFTASTII